MQEANEKTVLGDFKNTTFSKDNITTTFYKNSSPNNSSPGTNGRFMVKTDGPDGKLHDYEISYTFGVYPLQQYMVKFPQGRIQVLDIAWDSRTREKGGQRWFSLHPNEAIPANDVLHWTGPNLNWNYMCADCHSTNLKKNYNPQDKTYNTQWDVINVSCEACHGPASEHTALAQAVADKSASKPGGLTVNFPAAASHQWKINDLSKPELKGKIDRTELEVCARCHSRRSQLDDDFVPGDNFRDHYRPSLLTDTLYYPDGKIDDEVYVYGSFKQSLMYKAGVTCSDCHSSHTLKLKAKGDNVCLQCHLATSYATPKHHFHEADSSGASCITCHMPAKIYMGVDERNDHSFRIPRPDIGQQLDLPDACTNCHKGKQSQWAADAVKRWYGKTPQGYQNFAPALDALQRQNEAALTLAYGVLLDDAPEIAKATIVGRLGEYPSTQTLMTSLQMLRSKDADIRRQALQALQSFPLQHSISHIYRILNDPIKSVRLEAARILAAVPRGSLQPEQADLIAKVTEEYRQSLLFNADRPESQLSLAQLYSQQGQPDKAEAAFKQALVLQPQFIPAYVNYANFLQQQNREIEAYEILQTGLKSLEEPALYHSLGLWYVRNQQQDKALQSLQKAAEMESDNARYLYVYAVAIGEKQPEKAIKVLQASLQNHSGNMELLTALSSYYKQIGDSANAVKYRQKAEKVMQYVPR
jgi:tetratricopeptide (TPR) repeat protein